MNNMQNPRVYRGGFVLKWVDKLQKIMYNYRNITNITKILNIYYIFVINIDIF